MKSHFNYFLATMAVAAYTIPGEVLATEKILKNPLTPDRTDTLQITQLVGFFVSSILSITGVVALVMIIWGGTQIALNLGRGNDDGISRGKQTLLYAIIGLIVSFAGYVVVSVIIQALQPAQ